MAPVGEGVPDETVPDGEQMRVTVGWLPRVLELELFGVPPARRRKTLRVEVQLDGQAARGDAVVVHFDVEPLAFLVEPPVDRLRDEAVGLLLPQRPTESRRTEPPGRVGGTALTRQAHKAVTGRSARSCVQPIAARTS